MHFLSIVLLVSLCSNGLVAQAQKDSVRYLDYSYKEIKTPNGALFIEVTWPEANAWRAQVYALFNHQLIRDYYYTDATRKEKNGRYLAFHNNGKLADSCNYVANELNGDYYRWYKTGELYELSHYYKGNLVDTCYKWKEDGQLSLISITDSNGNGLLKEFHNSGKVQASGKLFNSLRHGKWEVFSLDGQLTMQLDFYKDSLVTATCYSADGTVASGDCIFEQMAEFKGGVEGWRKFLERNLKYPGVAQRKNINGVVRIEFMVDKTGELYDFSILNSPDESLSEEVIRLMKKSPKWQPAVRYNQPVLYRHIQAITFALQ